MPHYHDHGYKLLYSFPEMVKSLLTGFVNQDWIKQLDFSTLEKVNSSYITDDIRSRSDDIVWRVKFQGQWLYVYLLLEFQSTVNKYMAVRMQTYVGLLYQDLIKSEQLPENGKLPPVMPIVLYNGNRPWNAAQSITELLQPMPASLQAFQPQQQYWLIDEGRYSAAELEKVENLTAAIIRAELADDQVQFAKVAANLNIWLARPAQDNLRVAIKEWLLSLIRHRMPDIKVDELRNLTEIEAMLARDWSRKWIAQGEVKGKAEGKAEGEATLLTKLLTKRFGKLPVWANEKLNNATIEQLENWGEKIFDADTLELFFE